MLRKELQISDEHEGIMVLPENLELGKDFSSSYGYKFISIQLDITLIGLMHFLT